MRKIYFKKYKISYLGKEIDRCEARSKREALDIILKVFNFSVEEVLLKNKIKRMRKC